MKCSEPNCTRRAYAGRSHTMCAQCYRNAQSRARRSGGVRSAKAKRCTTQRCDRAAYCKGLCEPCYQRARRNDPSAPKCAVPGCTRPHFRLRDGVCGTCAQYFRRHHVYPTRVDALTVLTAELPMDWSVILPPRKGGA
jgi:hypothetical protein